MLLKRGNVCGLQLTGDALCWSAASLELLVTVSELAVFAIRAEAPLPPVARNTPGVAGQPEHTCQLAEAGRGWSTDLRAYPCWRAGWRQSSPRTEFRLVRHRCTGRGVRWRRGVQWRRGVWWRRPVSWLGTGGSRFRTRASPIGPSSVLALEEGEVVSEDEAHTPAGESVNDAAIEGRLRKMIIQAGGNAGHVFSFFFLFFFLFSFLFSFLARLFLFFSFLLLFLCFSRCDPHVRRRLHGPKGNPSVDSHPSRIVFCDFSDRISRIFQRSPEAPSRIFVLCVLHGPAFHVFGTAVPRACRAFFRAPGGKKKRQLKLQKSVCPLTDSPWSFLNPLRSAKHERSGH